MKLKDLLKESNIWDREFGQPLPTLEDAIEDHQSKKLKEGSAQDYIRPYNRMYKAYENFASEVNELSDFIDKAEGDKTDSKIIKKNFKKQVIPFIVLMKSWLKGKIK